MSDGDLRESEASLPRRKHGGNKLLSEIIREVLRDHGIGKDPGFRRVLRAWRDAAGTEIFEHTRIASFTRGVVTVEVDSGPLLHELAVYLKRDLLRLLREKAEAPVSDLKFRLMGSRSPG